ncbi:undecaprenyl-diphosphatase UppP [Fimbriimonadia bacterium ATM]|nr:MAG: undecaprenyl-diphosphatase UppP [Armatimonadota bacterium]MBC6970026.1 undecaprenyl-diphosphatase UppP [Armatimonadota bacterium]MCE7900665.1 undecaprenyl-diphosphatase UppP [Armatimonadetes bacterium ATM1]MDL1928545.1 undecaprenyl-diphosphatase UppP [Fimbriimonadia bacterium ATM]RIJ96139.1 MAG: undecaprenyl-diphosphatase UppP [Armatimonadota bacterium]
MHILEALILGIVQGLTEFLPVSSTAHVELARGLMDWPSKELGAPFTAVIQLGTLLAVFVYFRRDIVRTVRLWTRGLVSKDGRDTPEYRLGWAVFIGTLPIVFCALLFQDQIESTLRSMSVIALSLIALALLLWVAEMTASHRREMHTVRWWDGLVVGLFQAMALVPGVSRSGSTITGALFLGFDRATAARLSFLLSFPSILLAGVYEAVKFRADLLSAGLVEVVVATAAAFFVGWATIEGLLRFLRTHTTAVFIVYRVALGIGLLILLYSGVIRQNYP